MSTNRLNLNNWEEEDIFYSTSRDLISFSKSSIPTPSQRLYRLQSQQILDEMVKISNFGFIKKGNTLTFPCYKMSEKILTNALTIDDKEMDNNYCRIATFGIDDTGYQLIIFVMRGCDNMHHFLIIQASGNDATKFKIIRQVENINIKDLFLEDIYVCRHPIFNLKPYSPSFVRNIRNILNDHIIGKLDMNFLIKLRHIFIYN